MDADMTDRDEKVREALQELYTCGCSVIDALDDSDLIDADSVQRFEDALHEAKSALSHPAPDVPSADEVEAIRARHEAADKDSGHEWAGLHADHAHTDRATLIALLDAARETQRDAILAWRKRGAELDAARAELSEERAKIKKRLEADMFWDYDDAERPYDSVEELIQEREYEGEGIVEVQEAIQLPTAAYIYRIANDPEADDEIILERLSDEGYRHYRAAMSVASGARAMWSQMVDNFAAKLFEENPSPLPAWMHGKPWSSIDYNYKKYHRGLAHDRLAADLAKDAP
jgi:hypothetical protein